MYSLIVSNLLEDGPGSSITVDAGRFLEYSSEELRNQLGSLSNEAIECLRSWPCLLMQEGRGNERAFVARIDSIEADSRNIKLVFDILWFPRSILNDEIWKIRTDLDIADFEFSRNHWAVKDRQLFPVLENAGYRYVPTDHSKFQNLSLPAPSRRDLLAAKNSIGNWSHTEIDDLLLEAGIDELEAGRKVGSRRDRANAITEFALKNPSAKTAENSLFSAFVVHSASGPESQSQQLPENDSADDPWDDHRPTLQETEKQTRDPNRVFVVHGRNEASKAAVVEELIRLGLQPIILHEQPNMGRHLLTKFIEEADLATFAVVLMTDDDLGGERQSHLSPRARQNVILELGYFLSHLGQPRVCALVSPGLETPSDFDGIVYLSMDSSGAWKSELERELRAADMPIYPNL